MFKNGVLNRIYGNTAGVTVRMMNEVKMDENGETRRTYGGNENSTKNFNWKPGSKRLLGKHVPRWKDNIKKILRCRLSECVLDSTG